MDKPTLPPPPEPLPKPRGFCFIYLAVLFGFILAVGLSFVIMGSFLPFMIGFAVLAIIALQYFLWGWWFEKIYRSADSGAPGRSDGEREA
jgi:hypothetical protein